MVHQTYHHRPQESPTNAALEIMNIRCTATDIAIILPLFGDVKPGADGCRYGSQSRVCLSGLHRRFQHRPFSTLVTPDGRTDLRFKEPGLSYFANKMPEH